MVDLEIPIGVSSELDFYLLDNVEVRGRTDNAEVTEEIIMLSRLPSRREIKDRSDVNLRLLLQNQPRHSPFTSTAQCQGLTVCRLAVVPSPC